MSNKFDIKAYEEDVRKILKPKPVASKGLLKDRLLSMSRGKTPQNRI